MLHDNYLCLVKSDKQQIKEVKSESLPENSGTEVTFKRIWIHPMYSASVTFSQEEDKNEEIKSSILSHIATKKDGLEFLAFFVLSAGSLFDLVLIVSHFFSFLEK